MSTPLPPSLRFEANYRTDLETLQAKICDFLEENGFFFERFYESPHAEYFIRIQSDDQTYLRIVLKYNPEREEFGGFEIFRCTVLVLNTPEGSEPIPLTTTLNVVAYSRSWNYDHLVTGLQQTLENTFIRVKPNDDPVQQVNQQIEIEHPRAQIEPVPLLQASEPPATESHLDAEDRMDEGDNQIKPILPLVTDSIDLEILRIVQQEPDLTDEQVGARVGLSRTRVNTRRTSLQKMGYKVR